MIRRRQVARISLQTAAERRNRLRILFLIKVGKPKSAVDANQIFLVVFADILLNTLIACRQMFPFFPAEINLSEQNCCIDVGRLIINNMRKKRGSFFHVAKVVATMRQLITRLNVVRLHSNYLF